MLRVQFSAILQTANVIVKLFGIRVQIKKVNALKVGKHRKDNALLPNLLRY